MLDNSLHCFLNQICRHVPHLMKFRKKIILFPIGFFPFVIPFTRIHLIFPRRISTTHFSCVQKHFSLEFIIFTLKIAFPSVFATDRSTYALKVRHLLMKRWKSINLMKSVRFFFCKFIFYYIIIVCFQFRSVFAPTVGHFQLNIGIVFKKYLL